MLYYIYISMILFYCAMILAKPKIAAFMIWLPIFIYPNGWWYNQALLPLNMGYDDLLCVLLFVTFFVREILLNKQKIQYGTAFWAITIFTIILIVSNFNGHIYGEGDWTGVAKVGLKAFIFWALIFCTIHSIDSFSDLNRHLASFSIACALGGITVLIQYYNPELGKIFVAPAAIKNIDLYSGMRAAGSFMNPNGAACILAASIPLNATCIKFSKKFRHKILFLVSTVIVICALYATQSRSGLLAGLIGFLFLTVKSGQRGVAVILLAALLLTGIVFSGARDSFKARIADTYSSKTEKYDKNVIGRVNTWKSYLYTATPMVYLLGQGFDQGVYRNGMESHNVYVALLTVYGIGGFSWFLWVFFATFKKYKNVIANRCAGRLKVAISGCAIALAIWCIYGIASDSISSQFPRYLFFFIISLSDRIGKMNGVTIRSTLVKAKSRYQFSAKTRLAGC